jgi:membrane associated rhomboid family serine protease
MFPIGDDEVRGAGFGFVNFILIAINVIVFLFEATLDPAATQDFITRWGVIPTQILQGSQLITLLTSMFLHGGWLHLIGNMVFLWVFGDNVEAVFGHFGYLIFYLVGGLAASAAHIFFNPGSAIPSVGASGAISAVLGAYIVMFPRSQVRTLIFWGLGGFITRVSALIFLGIWFITQFLSGIASVGSIAQTGGVAVWAHIGGFVFGLIIGLLFKGRAANLSFGSSRQMY